MDSRNPMEIGQQRRKVSHLRTHRHEGGDVEERHNVVRGGEVALYQTAEVRGSMPAKWSVRTCRLAPAV